MRDFLPGPYLEEQHRAIDAGIQPFVDGAGDTVAVSKSLELLYLHLYVEEEILFPVLEKTGLTMPIFVMKREHGQMWPHLDALRTACRAGTAVAGVRAECEELFKLLRIHNAKEEQIVYTAADHIARTGSGETLRATLDAADAPDAWVCAMAPRGSR